MKPKVKLIGEDGNVFNLIGKVSEALRNAGQKDRAVEMAEQAFKCHSYDEVLVLFGDYVEIK